MEQGWEKQEAAPVSPWVLSDWWPGGWEEGPAREGPPATVQSSARGVGRGEGSCCQPQRPEPRRSEAAPRESKERESACDAPGGASGGQAPLLAAPAPGPRPAAQSTWSRHCRPALPTPGGAPGRGPSPGEARRGPPQLRLLEDIGGTGWGGGARWGGGDRLDSQGRPLSAWSDPCRSGKQKLQQLATGRLATRPRGHRHWAVTD